MQPLNQNEVITLLNQIDTWKCNGDTISGVISHRTEYNRERIRVRLDGAFARLKVNDVEVPCVIENDNVLQHYRQTILEESSRESEIEILAKIRDVLEDVYTENDLCKEIQEEYQHQVDITPLPYVRE